jgi:hypothetical protein
MNLEEAFSPPRHREHQGWQRKNQIEPVHKPGERILLGDALFLCDSLRLSAFAVRF